MWHLAQTDLQTWPKANPELNFPKGLFNYIIQKFSQYYSNREGETKGCYSEEKETSPPEGFNISLISQLCWTVQKLTNSSGVKLEKLELQM